MGSGYNALHVLSCRYARYWTVIPSSVTATYKGVLDVTTESNFSLGLDTLQTNARFTRPVFTAMFTAGT